ncbi:MAG: hypothetical protein H7Y02_07175, partial [Candidatus Obscuribacterales bacterium]|nr:hypothetical protein [Steroidobacteraceae bacterium]
TEALETFAEGLREAATLAEKEARTQSEGTSATALLSELAELRRAMQTAEQNAQQESRQSAASNDGNTKNDSDSGDSSGADSRNSNNNANGNQGGGNRSGDNRSGNANLNNGPIGDTRGGAWGGREIPTAGPRYRSFNQRLQTLTTRLNAGNLSRSDIEALREMAREIRRLPGDPLEQVETRKLLERLELAALAAAEQSRARAAMRSATPAADDARYRESIAEYYRKLGKQ